jgi:glutathionylspermidine synthase
VKRRETKPRDHWRQIVEGDGLAWHGGSESDGDGTPYWDESAFYEFSVGEIDRIEAATNELHQMCLAAAQSVIDRKLYERFAIPQIAIPLIERAWESEPPSLYGRFDLCVNPAGEIKMLEYNADTPTSLLEAAVIQWSWFEQTRRGSDQFNSIHDKLIATWKEFRDWIGSASIAFTSSDSVEDGFTLAYLQETAAQAGYTTESFPISALGWNGLEFVSGNSDVPLTLVFKLYPWEWMAREAFAQHLAASTVTWVEPIWKMLLSNKALLPLLWELYPEHPHLLEARSIQPAELDGWVRKPTLGREGANITIYGAASSEGKYGEGPFVYQRRANIPNLAGNFPVIGSWIVGQEAAGIGIRESTTPITGNLSRFVPHVIA